MIKRLNYVYKFRTFKALIKLSRSTAIFEFSSSNGYSSFNLNFECRYISIEDPIEDWSHEDIAYIDYIGDENWSYEDIAYIDHIGDENRSHFTYKVELPALQKIETACEERGYEKWDEIAFGICKTTFLG